MMEKESVKYTVNVREMVEFLLRHGDIVPGDAFFSPERALLGADLHSLSRNRTNNWKEVSSHDRNNLFRPEEWHDVQPSQAEPRQRDRESVV